MTTVLHPLSSADREAMTVLRTRLAAQPLTPSRASFDQLVESTPAAPEVTYREARVGGVSGTWCLPPSASPAAALLYLHGGAYMFGSARAFRHFVGQLSVQAGLSAFIADYRLAPEHPFPAAWEDASSAHQALVGEFGVEHVALAGDSAGGGLALALLSATAKAPCGVLFSPWTDLALTGASIEQNAAIDPLLTRTALATGADQYLRGQDPREPRASPLFAARAELPAVQIHVGTAEILLDDSLRLAQVARELHVWEGLPHVFPRSLGLFEGARATLGLAGAFLRAYGQR